ncbi:hypothetical protein [Candidatus Frankia alpina]|nr:hypothetical protein [Candidatus Frankia alpina]
MGQTPATGRRSWGTGVADPDRTYQTPVNVFPTVGGVRIAR